MTVAFKPLLAAPVEDLTKLTYPLLASPKLDGVRALVRGGVVMSRSLKPIPNKHVQALYGREECEGFDGELMCGEPTAETVFRDTTSAVMSIEGTPAVAFHVFDLHDTDALPFSRRHAELKRLARRVKGVQVVAHDTMVNAAAVDAYEAAALADGYEGVMLRAPQGAYKYGRSTLREGTLLKLKRFADAEAVIIGFEEQLHNANEAKRNALGRLERSSTKTGMVGKGTLGALRVRGLNGTYKGVEFNIGTGFDDALKAQIWKERGAWQGAVLKYKYFPTGSKEAPRFPVYLGTRDRRDM